MLSLDSKSIPATRDFRPSARAALLLIFFSGIIGCQKAAPEKDPSPSNSANSAPIESESSPTPHPQRWGRNSSTDPLPRLIETIQSRGGKVTRDETGIIAIDWHRAPINNLDLELLTEIPTLQRLYLSGTKIDSRGWMYLSTLPNLERLALWKTPFGDEDLQYLAHAKHLRVLDLSETTITGSGLSQLVGCQSLERLL